MKILKMKKNITVLLVMICMLLFNAKEAYMSGAAWVELTLDKVIGNSDVIAIVKKSQPPFIIEEVPVDKDQKKFPPFKKQVSLFEIVDILYANDNALQGTFSENVSLPPGSTIKVLQAGYDKKLNLHKRYYLEGAMKTIGIDHYKGYDTKLEKSKERIVFLRYNQNEKMLEFTADGSIEAVNKKDEIIKYLNSPR